MENKKLKQKIFEMSNSYLPLDMFYNDIRDNKQENYNKDLAFEDLAKITDFIIDLQDENKILHTALELMAMELMFKDDDSQRLYDDYGELKKDYIEKAKIYYKG